MKYYEHLTNNDFENEIWKPISGYPNYLISNIGRVKSLNYKNYGIEKILKPGLHTMGYPCVDLYKNGKTKNLKIHRLVASAFIDNTDSKPQVNHKNGVKTDNRTNNLEWMTGKENADHAWGSGLNETTRKAITGENNGRCKLSDRECERIRLIYSKGNITQKDLAEEFNCSQKQISRIINNKNRTKPTPK